MADQQPFDATEREVLILLRAGKSHRDAAAALGLPEADVDQVIHHLVSRFLAHEWDRGGGRSTNFDQFSPRQNQVLLQMCMGRSNKEIAAALDISFGWAKQLVSEVLQRSGTASRTEAAVRFALWIDRLQGG